MSRLADIREQDATGKAADIFAGIKKAMGKVPNAYLTIGGHSPAALQQALAHNAMLHKGSLSAQQLEAINLSVSEATGCDYCLAAHTLVTTTGTLPEADVAALRNAGFSDQQVIEIISAISAILFTNMVNRVNDTVVDFPKAD